MKKLFFLSLFLLLLIASSNAQNYSINKYKYDSRMYMYKYGDPYNPALSGLCSFFIPGLGQMISGETGRGFSFLGGSVGCGVIYFAGVVQYVGSIYGNGYSSSSNRRALGIGTMMVGVGGIVGLRIWSIVDAVKVAKVNNMYIQDIRKKSAVSLQFAPYIEPISINNTVAVPVGLSMRVTF